MRPIRFAAAEAAGNIRESELRSRCSVVIWRRAVMSKIRIQDLETITATKAKVHFGELLHQTSVEAKTFLISRQDKPISVIIGYKRYLELISGAEKKS